MIASSASASPVLERKMLHHLRPTPKREAETMKNLLRLGQFLFVLILLLIAGSVARSSVSDKLTIFTFSQPVELPGVTLPAGTYAFKLADTLSGSDVVQVWNKDQTHLYATFMSIPDYMPEYSEKTVIRFS